MQSEKEREREAGRDLITGCQAQLLSPVNPQAVTIKSTQAKHTSARHQAWPEPGPGPGPGKLHKFMRWSGKRKKKNIEAPVSDSKAQDDVKLRPPISGLRSQAQPQSGLGLGLSLVSSRLIDLFTSAALHCCTVGSSLRWRIN